MCPFDYFFSIFITKNSSTPHNSETVWDILIKLYRNIYQVKIMCRVQLRLLTVSELRPFDCVLGLFCIIYILVHTITHSEFSQNDMSGTRISVPPFLV